MPGLIALPLCLLTLGSDLLRFERAELHMATPFRLVAYAPDEATAAAAFDAAMERIGQLDSAFNDYDPSSELSRLGAASPTPEPVPVSEDLWRILERATAFAELTDGAFDPTLGPLTRLWRRSRRLGRLPSADVLHSAQSAAGYRHLRLQRQHRGVALDRAGMRLDLGGIGQGFAADEALAVLRAHGLERALVDASGDVACGAAPPGRTGWRIGIAPLEPDGPPSRYLELADGAVSTSGDAFQFVEIDAVRYAHIVDPRTGLGLVGRCSATVIAADCTTADALATAACVLGAEPTLALVARLPGVEVLLVTDAADGVTQAASAGFPRPAPQRDPVDDRPGPSERDPIQSPGGSGGP
jgi:thiamine biosynthesis lipoprotein